MNRTVSLTLYNNGVWVNGGLWHRDCISDCVAKQESGRRRGMDVLHKPQRSTDNRQERQKPKPALALTDVHEEVSPLASFAKESAELLHELNNVFVSVLLNTQVMEWKLPSYSRLRRNLHEVQRNAQRGGELAKRLLNRLDAMSRRGSEAGDHAAGTLDSALTNAAVAEQEPAPPIRCEHAVIESPGCVAPVFSPAGENGPHTPV